MDETHYRKLENLYLGANLNQQFYNTSTIQVSEGRAEIGLEIEEKYFHGMGAIHGSVYFKLLDDAAFFAVNSLVRDVAVLTIAFNIQLVRPVSKGRLRAVGTVKFPSRNLFVAESTLYDERGREVGFGTGNFAKSKVALSAEIGYRL